MSWTLSRFRKDDLVEVRSREEILATLDERGCVDGLPFMPEMLRFCGQRLRVRAVAHKTCDTAKQTSTGRRLNATVHLDDSRCDGAAHGGCQAECLLFWKDVWLKPATDSANRVGNGATGAHVDLAAHTRIATSDGERYACQATEMWDATSALAPWDVRQYVYDVTTGNQSIGRVLRVLWLALWRWLINHTPIAYRAVTYCSDVMHRWLTGRGTPRIAPGIARGEQTPTGRLNLAAGDFVRVKSQADIEPTLDQRGKNRGLSFDPEEMAGYCGGVYRVRKLVTQIIDEPSGKLIKMKQPCVMLDGVICKSEYASCRLNCPRAIPSYWREIWLEKVASDESTGAASNAAS